MRRSGLILWLGITSAAAFLACTDIGGPSRPVPYESRLFVPVDSNGVSVIDSLRFHWPHSSVPDTYWVEDSLQAPQHIRNAIANWRTAFLYGEWDAQVVADSQSADVIVRVQQPPVKPGPPLLRFASMRPECEGETVIDTVGSRHELSLPVRIYLNPRLVTDSLSLCLDITATHEMGHSMGLFQHSPDPNDILFSDPVVARLSARDIATVEALYHRHSDMVPVRP
jgi:predicted Zn-dependent protease